MTDTPIVGTHAQPPADEQVDGVVLFDPSPRAALEVPLDQPHQGRAWGPVLVLVAATLLAGAYVAYRRSGEPVEAPGATPPAPTVSLGPEGEVLTVIGGPRLDGQAGSSRTLEVRASVAGIPLPDTLVQFRVTQGGGLLEFDAARTDAEGVARTVLLLPRRAGLVVVTAEIAGADTQTTIAVEAHAGIPDHIAATDGDLQEGEVGELLPVRLAVTVLDSDGNAVPGSEIRFEVVAGGGIAAPTRARTDSLGEASALWRLGPEAGTQQVNAASSALGTSLSFTATARGRPRAGDGTVVSVEAGPVNVERREFVVGGSHVCELAAGVASCRGANDRGQRGTEAIPGFRALATGISHMCGLDESGIARCWGANEGGQLGDGSRSDRPSPVPVSTDLRFSSLTAGASHTCGVAGGGVPLCWGQNLSGQLGDGSRNDARFPRAVGGGVSFRILVAGWNHTCGLTANGNAFCWGQNSDGQLGDGSRLDRLVPSVVRGSITSLAAGSAHTCGISDGTVLCWGDNRFGQLGDGTSDGRAQPVQAIGLPGAATQIVAGAVHTCALVADGSAYCWGQNLHGQVGDGSTTNRASATAVAGGLRFRSIHAGGALTCGLAVDGAEYCWGLNQNGQLGDGSRQSRSRPTPVVG
ncbi:MAG: hypothetical protein ABL963_09575 [Longimicrobiales bacterium]